MHKDLISGGSRICRRGGGKVERRNFFDFESENGDFWCILGAILQFTVHCSVDCLNCFRRKKPLLVVKLAVVCMQIAIGRKTSVLDYLSSLFAPKRLGGLDFGR